MKKIAIALAAALTLAACTSDEVATNNNTSVEYVQEDGNAVTVNTTETVAD